LSVTTAASCGGSEEEGPLQSLPTTAVSLIVDVGEPVGWAEVVLRLSGGESAVVTNVKLLPGKGSPAPLKVLAVEAVGPGRIDFASAGAPPYSGRDVWGVQPVRAVGATVPPLPRGKGALHFGTVLSFTITSTRNGQTWNGGVEVSYRIGGKQYRKRFRQFVTICSPASQYHSAENRSAKKRCDLRHAYNQYD
jgi:hypothetical protein